MNFLLELLLKSDAIEFLLLIIFVAATTIHITKLSHKHELVKIEKLALLKASTQIDDEIKKELAKLE